MEEPPLVASPIAARAQPSPAAGHGSRTSAPGSLRVEFIAVSDNDELLEQLGQALDGDSVVRQVDTADAARDLVRQAHPCVVLLDVRQAPNAAAAIEQWQDPALQTVVVVFAAADQTSVVAGSIRNSAAFAVLPVPIEIAKTAAVLEGARDEALTRRSLAEAAPTPAPEPAVSAAHPAVRTHAAHHAAVTATSVATDPAAATAGERAPFDLEPAGAGRRPWLIGGIAIALLVAVVVAWLTMREPASETAPVGEWQSTDSDADAAQDAAATNVPAAGTISTPQPLVLKSGAVEDLLDQARTAFGERRYTDPRNESALVYYRSVLAQEPDNGEALEGLSRIAVVLEERLQSAIENDRIDDAAQILSQLKLTGGDAARWRSAEARVAAAQIGLAIENGNYERAGTLLRQAESSRVLPADQVSGLRADIDRRQSDARFDRFESIIAARIRDGRYVDPVNDSAQYHIAQMRKLPGSAQRANASARDLENAVVERARGAAALRQNDEMERWLSVAKDLGVSQTRLAAVRKEGTKPAAAAATTNAGEADRLAKLVQERIAAGRLSDPLRDSALQHLQSLRGADATGNLYSAQARSLSSRLIDQGRSALAARRFDVAQSSAAAARQIGIHPAEVDALERSIASARSPAPTAPAQPRVAPEQIKRTRYVAPDYPREAVLQGVEGSVKVRFTIGTEGKVIDVQVLQSTPPGVFDRAAVAAVRRWRFEPVRIDGAISDATMETSVIFKIDDSQR